ncbi:unnamed protein product [Caenorhabditis brenneri]
MLSNGVLTITLYRIERCTSTKEEIVGGSFSQCTSEQEHYALIYMPTLSGSSNLPMRAEVERLDQEVRRSELLLEYGIQFPRVRVDATSIPSTNCQVHQRSQICQATILNQAWSLG